ncbi:hypothetical protein GF373_04975 [bacterium]|nr:hypothetical protein [bacterium]
MGWFTLLNWGYIAALAIAWLVFVAHCIRQDNIYRPFNIPAWVVKTFWVVFLCTFSIWAFVAYIIWGFFIHHKQIRTAGFHELNGVLLLVFFSLAIPSWMYGADRLNPQVAKKQGEEWKIEDIENSQFIDFNLNFHAGTIEAKTNTNMTSAVSTSSNAKFDCDTIAIVLERQHPLLNKIAKELRKRLQEDPFISKILLLPSLDTFTNGGPLPSLWLRLDIPTIKGLRIGQQLSLDTQITMLATNKVFRNIHHHSETFSPPEITFSYNANVFHKSKSLFLGDKYKLPANEIAKELGKGFTKFMTKQRGKNGVMPQKIKALVPKKAIVPDKPIPFLQDKPTTIYGTRILTDYFGTWRIANVTDTPKIMQTLKTQLLERNWKKQSESQLDSADAYLRYKKANQRFVAFIQRKRTRPGVWIQKSGEKPTRTLILSLTAWTPKQNILQQLLNEINENVTLDFILMMRRWYREDAQLREIFQKKLENAHIHSPQMGLEAASFWEHEKNKTKQWKALKQAELLMQMCANTDQKSRLKREWKDFHKKNPAFLPQETEEDILQQMGMISMEKEKERKIQKTVSLNEPIGFYYYQDDKLHTLTAMMVPNSLDNSKTKYALRACARSGGGGSTSTTGGHPLNEKEGRKWAVGISDQTYRIDAQSQTQDNKQFELKLELR